MNTENLQFRILRKFRILNYINLHKRLYFAKRQVSVPVIGGLGYPNIFLKPNWLTGLVAGLFTSDDQVFIDVGANIGQTLISVKSIEKDIEYIGFEPDASCCHYLKKLIQVNGFENCHVYNFALSDRLKEDFLETNGEADPTGSLVHGLRPNFFVQRRSVFSQAYDSLSLNKNVSCVKIDVEGGELEVLSGMQKLITENQPYIICEILDSFSDDVLAFTQERADRVCDILQGNDYSIIQLVQNETTDRIVSFREISRVTVKQWTSESLLWNDYIFFPASKRDEVVAVLKKLSR
nr:FkbM family methyltransferase [uncultured Dyadobacter sp.]